MPRDLERVVGPLEAEVVEASVVLGPATVRQVLEHLNTERRKPLAYTTVMTVMSRLADKGILTRTAQGRGYVYEAASSDAAQIAVRSVVKEYGPAAVAHFVDAARADPKLLRRLERLMREE
jgi:predicted transcriptional regulator